MRSIGRVENALSTLSAAPRSSLCRIQKNSPAEWCVWPAASALGDEAHLCGTKQTDAPQDVTT